MKKVLKNPVFMFMLGLVIAGSIGVFATIEASNITYNGTTVDLVLDDLYDKANKNTGYAALFNIEKTITNVESYVPIVYSNSNYVDTITDGIKIKEAGDYKIIATSAHSANNNTTETRIYINNENLYTARHSIVSYDPVIETITLDEDDEIKVGVWSDGRQGTKQGSTIVLIKLS